MFRRRDSHKPPEELYMNFKSNYPNLGSQTPPASQQAPVPVSPAQSAPPSSGAQQQEMLQAASQLDTYKPSHGFVHSQHLSGNFIGTPSLHQSMSQYNTFGNPDLNHLWDQIDDPTFYQDQFGNSASHFAHGQPTPFSRPHSDPIPGHDASLLTQHELNFAPPSAHVRPQDLFGGHSHAFGPYSFNPQPVTQQRSAFQDGTDANSHGDTVAAATALDAEMSLLSNPSQSDHLAQTFQQSLTNLPFRFHNVLHTSTAYSKKLGDKPVSYLNKSTVYKVSVRDTKPVIQQGGLPVYRTFIRASFEPDEGRELLVDYWDRWNWVRGRDLLPTLQDNFYALEFVEPGSLQSPSQSAQIDLQRQDFDGFLFHWTPADPQAPQCDINLRFNFLSTDFLRSKGKTGARVRLCAKTQLLSDSKIPAATPDCTPFEPESTYCRVLIYRDHGADRKYGNDGKAADKNINKLKRDLEEQEAGPSKKRRRSEANAPRPTKKQKPQRSLSIESTTSSMARTVDITDEAELKARAKWEATKREINFFEWLAEERDDPDSNPLPESFTAPFTKSSNAMLSQKAVQESLETTHSADTAQETTPSGNLLPTPITAGSRTQSNEWPKSMSREPQPRQTSYSHYLASPQESSLKVPRLVKWESHEQDFMDVLDVDTTYRPPDQNYPKPVACFYVKPHVGREPFEDNLYRAIYLFSRTSRDLVVAIANKFGIEPNSIREVVRVINDSLSVNVDDDVVIHLPEGQDMEMHFEEASDNPHNSLASIGPDPRLGQHMLYKIDLVW